MAEHYPEVLRSQGESAANTYMEAVVASFRRTFRGTDVLADLGQGRIGVALLKAGAAEVEIPFLRMQNSLAGQTIAVDGVELPLSFKVSTHGAAQGDYAPDRVAACEQALLTLESGAIQLV